MGITNNDVYVHLVKFPNNKAKEMVMPCADGGYTVLINKDIASNQQIEAYNHAMKHIHNHDFDRDNVQKIELTAHE